IKKEGLHTVKFTGYDNVENSSTNTFMVRVDSTGPVIDYKLSTSPSTGKNTYPQHAILFLSSTDYIVGLEKVTYNINNSAQKIYSSPISRFTVGNKTMKVKAYDKLQNVTEKTITFTIE
ncbi:MAG: hypothetical protein MI922_15270, partial [Bacteroidales bacterium]|nr:hypothetical protein [Bacteroidales bacterium]